MGLLQRRKRAITAVVVGPAKLAAPCRGALSHGSLQPQPRHTMQIALPGSLHRVIMWLCTRSQLSTTAEAHDADRPTGLAASCHRVAVQQRALSHNYPPQPRRTMQIALPGSLHRVIVSLCTHSQLSTEAHDADRPAGLAASCHGVTVHSLTESQLSTSRGTRCRSPCRARCIVSLGALFQLSATCVQSAPVCESPASGAVT